LIAGTFRGDDIDAQPFSTSMNHRIFLLALPLLAASTYLRAHEPPADLGDPDQLGRGIQRTMTLLAESTPENRNTVRILFYGQSITEGDWWKLVADDLRERFPHANLVIENRALGGFSSQNLIRTADSDLYPFQPDLVIFHVYGAHDDYESIIRRIRERTTSEILIQTDHISAKAKWRDEETDPARITPKQWKSFMNYKHLPHVIRHYGCGFVDQRNLWKKHLAATGMEARELLKDGVHLNEHGCHVMAAFVNAALVKRDDVEIDPMNCGYVKTYRVGSDVEWEGETLRLPFEGRRVDLIGEDGAEGEATVRIDGKKPSEMPELQVFTRGRPEPGGKWPPVAPILSYALRVPETWTLEAEKIEGAPEGDEDAHAVYRFQVSGSRTGEDGTGRSDRDFVSDSGRVVIPPSSWNVGYALRLSRQDPSEPERFSLTWESEPRFVDVWQPAPERPGVENAITVADGLDDAPHVLELEGGRGALRAIRVYSPKAFPCPHHSATGDRPTGELGE